MPLHTRRTRLAGAALLALLPTLALGSEFDVAGGKLAIKGSATLGMSYRSESQDTDLLPNVNSSLVGITGTALTPSAGRNQDDGNLNFNKGDPVSQVLNAYVTLDYKSGNYGVLGSVKAWYDYALSQGSFAWGNFGNGYTAGAELSDAGAQTRSQFAGIVLDNLYVYGSNQVAEMPFEWRFGYQKLDWGNRYIVAGGLRELNAIDVPSLTRPGMLQRAEETRIAMPALFGRLAVTPSTGVEGFVQLHYERNAPNQCGTFFSALDYIADGCNAVMLGNQSDRAAVAAGNYVKRAETDLPSNGGQAGLALTHMVDSLETKFGLYATQFHSRSSYSSTVKSLRTTGAPYLPGDPGGLNPMYYTEYPEDIRMFGASFETKYPGGAAFGELTYRPNQPLQYNAADLISAFTSLAAPTPLRAQANAVAAGASFSGYERHKAVQLQLGAGGQLPRVLGAAGLAYGGELIYKGVPDLPDPSVVRFGRADVFGQGPVDGVCAPPATPTQCSTDGYVSKHAFGYRLRAGLRYPSVTDGVDLVPSLLFGHDVSGWSGDGGILEGRMLAIAALRANFRGGWTAELSWMPTWGGDYNNLRDRSTVQGFVGYQF